MLIAIFLLALLAVLAIAGYTGIGVADSRDTSYSLSATRGAGPCGDENQLAPGARRRLLASSSVSPRGRDQAA